MARIPAIPRVFGMQDRRETADQRRVRKFRRSVPVPLIAGLLCLIALVAGCTADSNDGTSAVDEAMTTAEKGAALTELSVPGASSSFPARTNGSRTSTQVATQAPPRAAPPTVVGIGVFQGCKSDGIVECWGSNDHGQLGQGHTNPLEGTVIVQDLSGVTALASGDQHVCALVGFTGEVFCWGLNDDGQLGVGDFNDRPSARRVAGISGAVMITTGDFHSCAVVGATRDLWCWGMNHSGQLGIPSNDQAIAEARKVDGFAGVVSMDGGFQHMCAVIGDGTVKCTGDDTGSQAAGREMVRRRRFTEWLMRWKFASACTSHVRAYGRARSGVGVRIPTVNLGATHKVRTARLPAPCRSSAKSMQ